MFDLGMQELIIIFIVALLVFGPKRLPELGRTLGKTIRDLKSALRGVQDTITEEANVLEEIKDVETSLKDNITKEIFSKTDDEEDINEKKKDLGQSNTQPHEKADEHKDG
jgi:Tat protein translocase TatB subunit